MKKEQIRKIEHAANRVIEAVGYGELLARLGSLSEASEEELRKQSYISSRQAAKELTAIFGDVSSIKNILCIGGGPGTYLDMDDLAELRRMIRFLNRDVDYRLDTINFLRDLIAQYAFLAYCLNDGILCHRRALELLIVAVRLYDLCQRLMPYVFADIEFGDGVYSTNIPSLEWI